MGGSSNWRTITEASCAIACLIAVALTFAYCDRVERSRNRYDDCLQATGDRFKCAEAFPL